MAELYVNKFDKTKACAVQGQFAEKTFRDILVSEGFVVREADFKEQRSHIDLIATLNNKTLKYDVKARKKVSRQDNNYQDELVWLELINVAGNVGWLLGAADYIVFEREKDFVIVNREKLFEFVKVTCDLNKKAFYPQDALYARYKGKIGMIALP
jgi:Holliday junction resolvase